MELRIPLKFVTMGLTMELDVLADVQGQMQNGFAQLKIFHYLPLNAPQNVVIPLKQEMKLAMTDQMTVLVVIQHALVLKLAIFVMILLPRNVTRSVETDWSNLLKIVMTETSLTTEVVMKTAALLQKRSLASLISVSLTARPNVETMS